MTCVIGSICRNGDVVMGADSAGVAGWNLDIRKDHKVFQKGEFIFGFTSSFRMGQILEYSFDIPVHDDSLTVDQYLKTKWINSLREALKAGGYSEIQNNQETGGEFLIGYRSRLFTVSSDFHIGESASSFDSVGCGAETANGAMAVLSSLDFTDEEKIKRALEISERFSAGVRNPFYTKRLNNIQIKT